MSSSQLCHDAFIYVRLSVSFPDFQALGCQLLQLKREPMRRVSIPIMHIAAFATVCGVLFVSNLDAPSTALNKQADYLRDATRDEDNSICPLFIMQEPASLGPTESLEAQASKPHNSRMNFVPSEVAVAHTCTIQLKSSLQVDNMPEHNWQRKKERAQAFAPTGSSCKMA